MRKFQIIHVTRFFEQKKFGGIEEVIKQISSNGNKSKFEHIVFCTGKNESKYK